MLIKDKEKNSNSLNELPEKSMPNLKDTHKTKDREGGYKCWEDRPKTITLVRTRNEDVRTKTTWKSIQIHAHTNTNKENLN